MTTSEPSRRGRRAPARDAVEAALAIVEQLEGDVHAWAYLDPAWARAEADRADRSGRAGGPLSGLVLGVKDIFDTAELPTAYGSPIYDGHQPRADAAVVALARGAGAAMLGKTVTAELACYHPGPTANPHRLTHTPGGSSSGSAAAVAAGMCNIAFGTQTAGSVIRPASFCGVYGFKPTFGSVPVAGTKLLSPSLDTVGWFARRAADLEAVRHVVSGRSGRPPSATGGVGSRRPLRLGFARTDQWDDAAGDCRRAVEHAAGRAADGGATVVTVETDGALRGLSRHQPSVQLYETARNLAWESTTSEELLSPHLRDLIRRGWALASEDYDRALRQAAAGRAQAAQLFLERDLDAVLTPAVIGEAPPGLHSTGDPRFARTWTLLGLPSISVPGLVGDTGLPIGVQLVGPAWSDAELIAWAGWLGEVLAG